MKQAEKYCWSQTTKWSPLLSQAYHRHCFSCGECNRSLDSTNICSGPDNELLCRTCYGKLFGPHGVGYGQGAGVLSMG